MINEEKRKELDSHWQEVIHLAVKYGFIVQCFGGTAILLTHQDQIEQYGEEKYLFRQRQMFGNDMEAQ